MATSYTLLPLPVLDIHDSQVAGKWKKFKLAWTNYSLATELIKKTEAVQVAMLLTVTGKETRNVFLTFTNWATEGDNAKIEPVMRKYTVSHERTCRLRGTVSTAVHNSRVRRMTITALLYESWRRGATSTRLPQTNPSGPAHVWH